MYTCEYMYTYAKYIFPHLETGTFISGTQADVICTFTDWHAGLQTGVFMHVGLNKCKYYNPREKSQ